MATIKPPKYIYVAGMRIPINVKEELPGSLAEYDPEMRCINIHVSILRDKQLFRSTIVHELIHCALDLAGVSFNMPTKTEEQIVTAVESLAAPAIVRVWRL
jgi:hypothetical protein|tara:strand:- start:2293 stop:2595 length:303 start_codon:yes stop_codon:yes gene_type:complete